MKQTWKQLVIWGSVLLLLSGCAAQKAFESGEELVRQGRYDEAVHKYTEALDADPDSQEYRMKLFDARSRAALEHLNLARKNRGEQHYLQAVSEYLQASVLDASLETANQEMRQVQEILHADELVNEAEEFYKQRRFNQASNSLDQALLLVPDHARALELLAKVRRVGLTLIDGVELDVTSTQPITLKFKNAKVKDVFKILSKLSGINFIFDEDIERQQISVFLEDATFAQALELLLKMNKLEKRVLNPKTVVLYPKTKEKEKQYQDLIIQTFYLSNIDAKKAVNMLRTMLQLRKIYVNEELNALVIRDKPQVIKLAEQILKAADRSGAEVVFDLELVGVSKTDLEKMGVSLSNYSVDLGFAKKGASSIVDSALASGSATDNLVSGLSNLQSFYTLPTATFDLAKTLTTAETLANPKLRVKNKEKAKIHVGTREPIITVTTSDNNTRSDNIQYVDVGVKLNVEPNIQLDNSVVTKLDLEVSSVLGEFTTESGTRALTIQTTTAQTAITLKDGERTILGGLLEDRSSKQVDSVPFLGDIPVLGALFSGHDNNDQKREILLSITPHIVKTFDLPKANVSSIWSGSEDAFQVGPSFQSFAKDFDAEQKLPRPHSTPAFVPNKALKPLELTLDDKGPSPQVQKLLEESEPQLPEATPAGPVPAPAAKETPTAKPADSGPKLNPTSAGIDEAVQQKVAAAEHVPELNIPIPEAVSRAYFEGPKLVNVGDQFSLQVRVDGIENLYSAPMFVTYDAQNLDFVQAVEGDFLRSGGSATVFTTSPNQSQGRIIIGYKQGAGGQGVSGDGVLYRLVFRARKPGMAKVNLDRINFRDPAGNRLKVTVEGTLVEVR